jgi:hypothetical protein
LAAVDQSAARRGHDLDIKVPARPSAGKRWRYSGRYIHKESVFGSRPARLASDLRDVINAFLTLTIVTEG